MKIFLIHLMAILCRGNDEFWSSGGFAPISFRGIALPSPFGRLARQSSHRKAQTCRNARHDRFRGSISPRPAAPLGLKLPGYLAAVASIMVAADVIATRRFSCGSFALAWRKVLAVAFKRRTKCVRLPRHARATMAP
jgi:hypothetical protein